MSRPRRHSPGGMVFDVLKRGVGRRLLFTKDEDFLAFERVVEETLRTRRMRLCACCLMPNHWHFVVWPERDGDLPAFMQQVTNTRHGHGQAIGAGIDDSAPWKTEETIRGLPRLLVAVSFSFSVFSRFGGCLLFFSPFLLIILESKKVPASADNIQPKQPEPARSLILRAKRSGLPPHVREIILDPRGILMTHPPGSSSLLQREIAQHRALLVVFLVSAGVCLSFDQLGKWWAFASWREPARISQVVPGLYAGAQARNYGGIYSLEGHGTSFLRGGLAIVGFVVLGMVFRWAIVLDRDRWCKFDAAAAGLLLAGALGNQVDRLALGYVRDYVILAIRPTDVFNTADVFMVLGALLLLGSLMIHRRIKIAHA